MTAWLAALLLTIEGAEPAQISAAAPDVVVVCPPGLQASLGSWVEYRRRQGHVVALVAGDARPAAIKGALKQAHAANPQLSVVIVGDADPNVATATHAATDPKLCVPAHLAEAKVTPLFGSEPEIATDNWYVDFDGDDVPEAPIGRLPVDSPEELEEFTRRIAAYERWSGAAHRKVHLVAGIGGFGVIADTAIEAAAKTLLTRHLPPAYETTLTQASWQSPYCPGPPQFRNQVIERFNEGALLWVYIGHGYRREVDRLRAPDGLYPIFSARDVRLLQHGGTLALFLSCYSGAFDGAEDCLAEEMIRRPGGPVGVLSGSRVTMPYAMSVLGKELMTAVFHSRVATLGEALRDAKRALMLRPRTSDEDKQFDALAKALMPMAADLDAQRREHLHLFNLLGDPLLRLPRPEPVEIVAPAEVRAGEPITVVAASPIAGRATIELVVRRDRLTTPPPPRETYDVSPAGMLEFAETYSQANDGRLATATIDVPAGRIEHRFAVPLGAKGECHVRVYVEGENRFALGSSDVKVLTTKTKQVARP